MLGPMPGSRDRDDRAYPQRTYSWVEQSDLWTLTVSLYVFDLYSELCLTLPCWFLGNTEEKYFIRAKNEYVLISGFKKIWSSNLLHRNWVSSQNMIYRKWLRIVVTETYVEYKEQFDVFCSVKDCSVERATKWNCDCLHCIRGFYDFLFRNRHYWHICKG